ncbi:MAG: metal ABC transporter permease [Verrucomicrobiae bacterium]|nr:metal ABC transporter permease [Verrucomicrobiae bacterium]
MIEILAHSFMQRALAAGLLVGIVASYYGVFVVQRGMGFLGHGLAHAAFGGVALGILLNAEPLWVAIPFTLAVAIGITWARERSRLGVDSVIGIFLAISMALGVVFLSLKRSYAADAFGYLFGSILSVTTTDLLIALLLFGLALATLPMWGRWAYATLDREAAMVDRLPVARDDYVLSCLIAVTVVAAVKIVGVLLIAAFLVIPAAASRLLARSFLAMTVLSVLGGGASVVFGLAGSYWLDIPSGAAIILVQGAVFLLLLGVVRRA